jgi:hypothetical protein
LLKCIFTKIPFSTAQTDVTIGRKDDSPILLKRFFAASEFCVYFLNAQQFCRVEPDKSKYVSETMATACKHPRVRVVSRHEDMEFVECLECSEVFDSEEFRDMEIEESVEAEAADAES